MNKIVANVGDLRDAVQARDRMMRIDAWYEDTGRSLVVGTYDPSELRIDVLDEPTDHSLGNVGQLLDAVQAYDRDAPVRARHDGAAVVLVAVGPEGENTDFSFHVHDASEVSGNAVHPRITDAERRIDPNPADWDDPTSKGASVDDRRDTDV